MISGRPIADVRCDAGNGDITLPPGFCATVFADLVGVARHIVIGPTGVVYVTTGRAQGTATQISRLAPQYMQSSILVLRDTNRDGRVDAEQRVPYNGRTGIALAPEWLYVSDSAYVLRFRLRADGTIDPARVDTVVTDMPDDLGHRTKSLAFDASGGLFVSSGSRSNACRARRTDTAPDPCPELPVRSGIWRYDATKLRQLHPRDGERWATGVRNALGLAWNAPVAAMFATSHGRDALSTLYPQYFSVQQNAELPAEEFFRVDRGIDIGWPYCFYDPLQRKRVLAPEYGGDGRIVGRCASMTAPLIGFPGHWAPNALVFYTGSQFPARYRGGAFIAFHGSWNRIPLAEAGYKVVFAPFRGNAPTGEFETFADAFAGDTLEPLLARHRPTGLAQSPDGALFIVDDMRGRIWRVQYTGGR
jgi:glucose/arabinose dehydrogenase